MEHDVCAAEELVDGRFVSFEVGTTRIGVLRRGEDVVAFRDRCPHQDAPICSSGFLRPFLTGELVGAVSSEHDRCVLICPWHGWEFELETGRSLVDGRYRLRTYRARVEGGRVLVDAGPQ
jgi:nitrite reductase (NADH) small subunit